MNVRRASTSLKCQAFPLTLIGAARQWYRSLKPGTISSFDQLKGEFLGRFIGSKTRKKDKTHLWSLKQGKDETLKKYIDRFSEGMNLVDEFTDTDVLSALREGLQEGELLTSIIRRAPKTFGEFLARAQEFVNVEEYLQSRKNHKGEGKRKSESEAKEGDSKKMKVEKNAAKDNKKPSIAPRFQAFTPLNTTPEQILMQIENRNILTRPEPMRTDPDKRDRTKYCQFHNDHGHLTSDCIHLKRQIEALIQQGELKEFVNRVIDDRQNAPRLPAARNNNLPALPAPQQRNLQEIRTIFGGLETGNIARERKSYAGKARDVQRVHYVNMAEHVAKFSRVENVAITFTGEKADRVLHPHNDALVVSLTIANNLIHQILIDNRSSTDVIFKRALHEMGLENVVLRPVKTPLYGFSGEQVEAEGMIALPVTMGEVPAQTIRMINFLVVDRPSVYNVIIGRPTLNSIRAITSTYHLAMKFPTDFGIGVIMGDQKEARICYIGATNEKKVNNIVTIFQVKDPLPVNLDEVRPRRELDPKDKEKRDEVAAKTKEVCLDDTHPEKTVKVGAEHNPRYLCENTKMYSHGLMGTCPG